MQHSDCRSDTDEELISLREKWRADSRCGSELEKKEHAGLRRVLGRAIARAETFSVG